MHSPVEKRGYFFLEKRLARYHLIPEKESGGKAR